jgi:hypothetical protein
VTATQVYQLLVSRLGGEATALIVYPRTEITDALLRSALKVGQEVQAWKEPQTTQAEQTCTGDGTTVEFALAADFLSTLHATLSDTTPIVPAPYRIINQEDANDLSYSEESPVYYLRSYHGASTGTGFIGILPAMATGVTATHHYIATVTITSLDTALLDIPSQYHEAIGIYSHWDLSHRNTGAKPQIAEAIYNEYERSIKKAVRDTHGIVDKFPVMYDTDVHRYEEDW